MPVERIPIRIFGTPRWVRPSRSTSQARLASPAESGVIGDSPDSSVGGGDDRVVSWTGVTEAVASVAGAVAIPGAIYAGFRSLRLHHERVRSSAGAVSHAARAIVLDVRSGMWSDPGVEVAYETLVATVINQGDRAVFDLTLHWRSGDALESDGVDFKGPLGAGQRWQCPAPASTKDRAGLERVGAFVTFFDYDSRGWAKTQRGDIAPLRFALYEGW